MERKEIRDEFKRVTRRYFKKFEKGVPAEDPLTAIDHALRSIERRAFGKVVSQSPRHILIKRVSTPNRSFR